MLANTKPIFVCKTLALQTEIEKTGVSETANSERQALLAIVIDDFGGWERAGVNELLSSDIAITCAIMPFVENSQADYDAAVASNKEVILHMPMQAHVGLPESWYGPTYIKNYDSPEVATQKLEKCLKTMPEAKGFNIHIGSGASRNKNLMMAMYDYANKNNLLFLDSRTNLGDKCEEASHQTGSIYLGRDVFLEPHKNRSFEGVTRRLKEATTIAKEKGYAIAIGHVGAEGGANTARAIINFAKSLDSDVKIVPLSSINNFIKQHQYR